MARQMCIVLLDVYCVVKHVLNVYCVRCSALCVLQAKKKELTKVERQRLEREKAKEKKNSIIIMK